MNRKLLQCQCGGESVEKFQQRKNEETGDKRRMSRQIENKDIATSMNSRYKNQIRPEQLHCGLCLAFVLKYNSIRTVDLTDQFAAIPRPGILPILQSLR